MIMTNKITNISNIIIIDDRLKFQGIEIKTKEEEENQY
jgi:hypothetical protein